MNNNSCQNTASPPPCGPGTRSSAISLADISDMLTVLVAPWLYYTLVGSIRMNLFDRLDTQDGLNSIAQAVNVPVTRLRRLLNVLCAADLVARDDKGHWRPTSKGNLLRSDSSFSLRELALTYADDRMAHVWRELDQALTTSAEVPFIAMFDEDIFSYMSAEPKRLATFNGGMAAGAFVEYVAPRIPVEGSTFIVDVGGGNGALLSAVAQCRPEVSGVVFDRPGLSQEVQNRIATEGLSSRLGFLGGNFFEDDLPPASCAILSRVLHDWDDDECTNLLLHVIARQSPGFRVVIVERILETKTSLVSSLMDLHMLLMTGGRERSYSDMEALIKRVGLVPVEWTDLIGGLKMLTAELRA